MLKLSGSEKFIVVYQITGQNVSHSVDSMWSSHKSLITSTVFKRLKRCRLYRYLPYNRKEK
jgi:hypothetical protein